MLRYFSRVLIVALTLAAPLSFLGDCPDLKATCNLSETERSKTEAVIVKKRAVVDAFISASPVTTASKTVFLLSPSLTPARRLPHPLLHERAPPVTTPLVALRPSHRIRQA